MCVIRVSNLRKEYDYRVRMGFLRYKREVKIALENISFEITLGELVGLIGPNGSGKSTTIKILCGILRPTSGSVTITGLIPWNQQKILAKKIGVVFGQRSQLSFHLSVRESFKLLSYIYEMRSTEFRNRLNFLSESLEITTLLDMPVRKLSLGERIRCEIVAALLHSPQIIILDEPTIGLDIFAKNRLRNLISEISHHDSVTVLITSHDLMDIEKVCDRVIGMQQGNIVCDLSTKDFNSFPSARSRTIRINYLGAFPKDKRRIFFPKEQVSKQEEGCLEFTVDSSEELPHLIAELNRDVEILDIDILPPSLEDCLSKFYMQLKK